MSDVDREYLRRAYTFVIENGSQHIEFSVVAPWSLGPNDYAFYSASTFVTPRATLERRVAYGGRKGRSAARRLAGR